MTRHFQCVHQAIQVLALEPKIAPQGVWRGPVIFCRRLWKTVLALEVKIAPQEVWRGPVIFCRRLWKTVIRGLKSRQICLSTSTQTDTTYFFTELGIAESVCASKSNCITDDIDRYKVTALENQQKTGQNHILCVYPSYEVRV